MNEDTKQTAEAVLQSDELGPDERAKLDALLDHIHEHGTSAEGVFRRAADLCAASRAVERERSEMLRQALLKCKTCALPSAVRFLVNAALRA